MSVIFADGFDSYPTTQAMRDAGWSQNNPYSGPNGISLGNGRYGGAAVRMGGTSSGNNGMRNRAYFESAVATGNTLYLGVAVMFKVAAESATTYGRLVGLIDAANQSICSVNLQGSMNSIQFVGYTGTTSSTTSFSFATNVWYWLELKVVLGTTTSNGSAECRINGSVIMTATGINTNGIAAGFLFGPGGGTGATDDTPDTYFDDIVVTDSGYLGDSRIDSLLVTADGSPMDWTPSAGSAYQCIDDALNSGSDTDYISSGTASQKAQFPIASLPTASDAIHAVNVKALVRNSDAGARTFNAYLDSNGSIASFTAVTPNSSQSNWMANRTPISLDPDGGVAWTDAKVNALKVGVNVAS